MAVRRKNMGLGVDLGSAALKSVVLGEGEGEPTLLAWHRFNVLDQGILNEAELYTNLSTWLDETKVRDLPITIGLPQFLATTQLTDFPLDASRSSLEEMVAFETQQLAGLSEEGFVHDFHVLPAGSARKNPVLIGICRESVIEERMAALRGVGISLPRLAMDGLASANAFLLLHGEQASATGPQLVIDIGREKSTLVVLVDGQPLFVGSLLFSADKFVRAAMDREGLNETAAAAHLLTLDLKDESPRSPYILLCRQLVSEVENALEHWRSQERNGAEQAALGGLWLCGGGSRLRGLQDYLADCFECSVEVFGPRDPDSGDCMPDMAAAYGLAAQALGIAPVQINLTPMAVRQDARRRKRFGFLIAACVLASACAVTLVTRSYVTAERAARRASSEVAELAECEKLIPRLERAKKTVKRCESQLIPLVQSGNRSRRFVEAIDALGQACSEKDWFIYLADEASYQRRTDEEDTARGSASDDTKGKGLFPGHAVRPVVGDTVLAPEFPRALLAAEAPGMVSLIAAGYTPLQRYQPWEPIRTLIDKLRALGPYGKVDLLLESERVGREDIFAPWVRFFRSKPGLLYKPFSLRLRVAIPDVAEPAKEKTRTAK